MERNGQSRKDTAALIEMLERLEEKDKIVMNRTAGLNMIYWEKGLTGEMIVKNYYER